MEKAWKIDTEARRQSYPALPSAESLSSVPPLIIKKAVGIAGAVIVRTEHLGREGFPERAGPADACQVIYHADCLIYQADQSCLVHIYTTLFSESCTQYSLL